MKMSKKRKKLYKIQPKETKSRLVIDQNKFNRQKAYHSVDFRVGKHMIEKDRPRKKYNAKDVNLHDV